MLACCERVPVSLSFNFVKALTYGVPVSLSFNPFRIAVPFGGQTTWNLTSFVPKNGTAVLKGFVKARTYLAASSTRTY